MAKLEVTDPFVLMMRKGAQVAPGMRKTGIVVMNDTWEEFKLRCKRESISPSEQLHHLMRDWLRG